MCGSIPIGSLTNGNSEILFNYMEKIILHSRFGHEVFLKKVADSQYELHGNFCLFQVTKDETGELIAIDPEGGPMISVGDQIQDGRVISQIISEDDRIVVLVKTRSCLNCARFTNFRADLHCSDINTPMPKEVDIRKGCDKWEEKDDTNWYLIPSEDGFVKKELTREDEDEIYKEFIFGNNPCERMSDERLELAQHIKWRRVLENA